MSQRVTIRIILLVAVAFTGCADDDAASSGNVATPAAVAQEVDVVVGGLSEADVAPQPETASASERSPTADTIDEQPEDEAAEKERIAILMPGGPLLVDVWVTIDGRSHVGAFDALVIRVLDAGDSDGDGRSTWQEWAANEEFLTGPLANLPQGDKRTVEMWVERYDENRDKRMQPSEAAAWLGRDAGRSLRPLALRSRRSYLAIPSLNSRAWQLLDANGDEVLVDTEIANAPHRLWLLDADDDRIVTLPELATLRDQLGLTATPMASPTFAENRPAAIHLDQETEVDRLNYRLADLYAPRQNLGPASFPGLPGLFESLDADGNDWLSGPELALLLTIEPHLELLVTFAEVGSLGLPPASLRVEGHAPEIEISAEPAANRIVVSLGGSRLLLSAHDLAPSRSEDQSADRNSVRLMVHDDCDALFEELDANADGRLGEREIATCSERLAALDDSQDGRIESDELAECMVVAFLRGEPAGNQSFYVPNLPVTSTTPASAVPPWFARADFNGDGDVSRREFVGTREQFSRLDTDGDGFINAAEAAAIPAKTN